MSLESVQADLAVRAPDLHVIVTADSTATVQLAAAPMAAAPKSKVLSFMTVSLWRYGVPGGIAQSEK